MDKVKRFRAIRPPNHVRIYTAILVKQIYFMYCPHSHSVEKSV